ncbi:MAG: hypothetical protein HQM07_04895 [Zetaproteobacteria bacterium]|nr:hypothetical protein [Zetaproteobacteria bacterium]
MLERGGAKASVFADVAEAILHPQGEALGEEMGMIAEAKGALGVADVVQSLPAASVPLSQKVRLAVERTELHASDVEGGDDAVVTEMHAEATALAQEDVALTTAALLSAMRPRAQAQQEHRSSKIAVTKKAPALVKNDATVVPDTAFDVATMGAMMLSDWAAMKQQDQESAPQINVLDKQSDSIASQQPIPVGAQCFGHAPGSFQKKSATPLMHDSFRDQGLQEVFLQAFKLPGRQKSEAPVVVSELIAVETPLNAARTGPSDDVLPTTIDSPDVAMQVEGHLPAGDAVEKGVNLGDAIEAIVLRLDQVAQAKAALLQAGKFHEVSVETAELDGLDELLRVANMKLASIKEIDFMGQFKEAYQEAASAAKKAAEEVALLRVEQLKHLERLRVAEKDSESKAARVAKFEEQRLAQEQEDDRLRQQKAALDSLKAEEEKQRFQALKMDEDARIIAALQVQKECELSLQREAEARAVREVNLRLEREKRMNEQIVAQMKAEQRARLQTEEEARNRLEKEAQNFAMREQLLRDERARIERQAVHLEAVLKQQQKPSVRQVASEAVVTRTSSVASPLSQNSGDLVAVNQEGVVDGVINVLGEGLGGVISLGSNVVNGAKKLSIKRIFQRKTKLK